MNVHEYQAKAILRDYGVPVPRGHAAFAPEEAVSVAKELGGPVWVVKAQIHAGGRGKGHFKEPEAGEKGGVRVAKSIDDVRLVRRSNAVAHARDACRRARPGAS